MKSISYLNSRKRKVPKFISADLAVRRINMLKVCILLATLLIGFRLIQLQLFDFKFYNELAIGQYNNISKIPAERGKIYLENSKTGEKFHIATNRTMDMIYVDPKVIEEKEATAETLAPILEMKKEEIFDKINKQYKDYIRLVIEPEPELVLQIEKLDLPGIGIKNSYEYKLDELKYEEEEVLESFIVSMDDVEKELLKESIVEINANPTKIIDLSFTCKVLSEILEDYSEKDLLAILTKKELRYVPIKSRLTLEQSDKIDAAQIYGVVLIAENWRFYPEKAFASHILGFVDKQGLGQYGIEGQYDTELKGQEGQRKVDLDIRGNPIAVGENQIITPVKNGVDYVLTLNRSIQKYAEVELAKTVEKHLADSGSVVVMNPHTGEIITMADYPTFDPNEFFKAYERSPETDEYINKIGPKVFFNSIIASTYEFGSTFKAITVSTALDSGEMSITDTVCDETGEVSIDNFIIRNADLKAHECLTLSGVLEKSSNIGALRVGLKVGSGVLRKYIIDFGFGEYTDIGFNNENNGYLGPVKEWGKVKTANASFGQGITGTPIQLVRAISAIANQGKLVQPYLIKEIISEDRSEKTSPREVRRVITPSTAAKVSQMMLSAVDNGVASPAGLDRWSVAAKTGTAQVATVGGYSTEKYIASVVGFAPALNPQFVMLVKIDYPKTSKFGSEVAAPLFKNLSEYILKYYEVPYDR